MEILLPSFVGDSALNDSLKKKQRDKHTAYSSSDIHLLLITCGVLSWQLMVKHSGAAEHDGSEDEGEMERSEALEVCLFGLALQRFRSTQII